MRAGYCPGSCHLKLYVIGFISGVTASQAAAQPSPSAPATLPPQAIAAPITMETVNRMIGGQTLVSLHLKDVSPSEAYKALSSQARQQGLELENIGELKPASISVDFDRQPFWTALAALNAQLHLYPLPGGWTSGRRVVLSTMPNGRLPVDTKEEFVSRGDGYVVVAKKVRHQEARTQTLDGQAAKQSQDDIFLEAQAFLDPKILVLPEQSEVRLDTCLDEAGQTVAPIHTLVPNAFSDYYSNPFTFQIYFRRLAGALRRPEGRRIAQLRATLRLAVPTGLDVWDVPDILNAQAVKKTVEGQVYTIERVDRVGANYEVYCSVIQPLPPGAAAVADHPSVGMIFQAIRLTDARRLDYGLMGDSRRSDGNRVAETLRFEPMGSRIGPPDRLLWTIPTGLRILEIPLEFHDIPVP